MDNSTATTSMKYSCLDCNFSSFTEHEIILHWSCFSHRIIIPPLNVDGNAMMELEGTQKSNEISSMNDEKYYSNDIYCVENKENVCHMDFEVNKRNLKRKLSMDHNGFKKAKVFC